MTAEIAIINRSAVTLAADSAVTINVGGTEKIYNTADKLFELSRTSPVGIMIFNNMTFMGVPIDVLIKEFRSSSSCKDRGKVHEFTADFLDYLKNDVSAPTQEQNSYVSGVAKALISGLEEEFLSNVSWMTKKKKNPNSDDIHNLFLEALQKFTERLQTYPICDCFNDISQEYIVDYHIEAIDFGIKSTLNEYPLSDDDMNKLRQLVGLSLHRNYFSKFFTGIVIAGFGSSEMFPALYGYEVDGIVAGRLKLRKTNEVVIDRQGTTADVIPFAQRDMVDRFLYGVDDGFEEASSIYMRQLLDTAGESLVTQLVKSKRKQSQLKKAVSHVFDVAMEEYRTKTSKKIKESFKKEIRDMVLFMPKQEMANMAESMINLTSTKRRVSAEQETVGGPVDVAVISKGEGFVWVKRKHYFEPSLNPRYLSRKKLEIVSSSNVGDLNDRAQ